MRLLIAAAVAASAFALPAAAQTATSPEFSVSGGYARFVDGSEEWDGHSVTGRATARLHRYFGLCRRRGRHSRGATSRTCPFSAPAGNSQSVLAVTCSICPSSRTSR